MSCKEKGHGAIYRDYKGKWSCLICGEEVDDPIITVPKIEDKPLAISKKEDGK